MEGASAPGAAERGRLIGLGLWLVIDERLRSVDAFSTGSVLGLRLVGIVIRCGIGVRRLAITVRMGVNDGLDFRGERFCSVFTLARDPLVSPGVGVGGKLLSLRLTLNRRLMSHRRIPDSLNDLITLDRTQTL